MNLIRRLWLLQLCSAGIVLLTGGCMLFDPPERGDETIGVVLPDSFSLYPSETVSEKN